MRVVRKSIMANPDTEIVTADADAPAPDSPPVASTRNVSIVVYLMLIALPVCSALTTGAPACRGRRTGRRPVISRSICPY